MGSSNSRSYTAHGHDYTDEITRYTQQPGPEVNDVSRFTHGVDGSDDEDLNSLIDAPRQLVHKKQSVGSRVERRRSTRRAKK